MAWITGTATDLLDLFAKIKDELVDNGWTVNEYSTDNAAPRTHELYVEGPGYSAGYEVYAQLRTYVDAPNNHYCIEARGATEYDAGFMFEAQPGVTPDPVYMRVWNAGMTYWMSISDRRFVIIVKCSNTYHSLYAGYFNPFANPVEYPYPYYVAADAASPGQFGNLGHTVRSIAFPGSGAAYMRDPGGIWRNVAVYAGSAYQTKASGVYTIWPYHSIQGSGASNNGTSNTYPPEVAMEPLPGVADSLMMMNCYIMGLEAQAGILGVLEGVYWIPGNLMSTEQELTYDGETFRAFCGISRSIEIPSNFYAVKEA